MFLYTDLKNIKKNSIIYANDEQIKSQNEKNNSGLNHDKTPIFLFETCESSPLLSININKNVKLKSPKLSTNNLKQQLQQKPKKQIKSHKILSIVR